MIENQTEVSKGMENALKALEQAKARVAAEKRKASNERRKQENHCKYIMGGIVHKYFPECYMFDEEELNTIIGAAMKTDECRNAIAGIRRQNGQPGVKPETTAKGSE